MSTAGGGSFLSVGELQPMFVANELLDKRDELQARLQADGYLLFRGIIPAPVITDIREQITQILAEIGWIEGGVNRMVAKAIGVPQREGDPGYFVALDRILKLEALHSLAHEGGLMAVMQGVLGTTAFPHPLSICRLVFPNNPEITTPPHQDYPNNQGTEQLIAAWIPLGDCPREMGSLAILKGSHKLGLLPLQFHVGAGNRRAVLPNEASKLEWVAHDFRAGDVLLFLSLTVHSALANEHSQNMRLSVDFRYQLEGEALTKNCLNTHFNRFSWSEIYAGWQSKKYQYYWKDKDYEVVTWDESLHALPEGHMKEALSQVLAYEKTRRLQHGIVAAAKQARNPRVD